MKDAMQTIGAAAVLTVVGVTVLEAASPVKQIDHVMFSGGAELAGLIRLLRDKVELPIVFDGQSLTPPSGGTCFSFGNVCLEVSPLPAASGNVPRRPQLGSLALHAVDFATTAASLNALQIDHFPPAEQTLWTTIGVRGLGGLFFIEYREGMSGRRERFRRELDARRGGPLGVVRMLELSQVRANVQDSRASWIRLFGESLPDTNLWIVGDGPASRVVAPDDARANRVVVQIRDRANSAEALRRFALPFTEADGELLIDPTALFGLNMVLKERQ